MRNKKKNIALLMLGIGNLRGGGGAERFFADLYSFYNRYATAEFKLYFILDKQTKQALVASGKILLPNNLIVLPNFNNRFKNFIESFFLYCILRTKQIQLLHIVNYTSYYYPFVAAINKNYFKLLSIKLTINIVDALLYLTYYNFQKQSPLTNYARYSPLFLNMQVHGVFSWYKAFAQYAAENKIIKSNPVYASAAFCFTDTKKFYPATVKDNHIVYAARLEEQKHPEEFVEAVFYLYSKFYAAIAGWTFYIFGKGKMEDTIREKIQNYKIDTILKIDSNNDMSETFNRSKCFVSTQEVENFTSLSMLEAMASGNVIIAKNVGQTALFVEDGKNGFLSTDESPQAIAMALLKFIDNQTNFKQMSNHSIYMANEVHTPKNFISQIEKFWATVLENTHS